MSEDATSEEMWKLEYGFHKGTPASVQTTASKYDSEEDARNAFETARNRRPLGYVVYFAYLTPPNGRKITLDVGTPYS